MSGTIVVAGGTVVTETGPVRADLVVAGERIVAIMADAGAIAADERVDATGLLVLPGGVDAHTHFLEPDPEGVEGLACGSAGAAAGGITTVVEMPQAGPTNPTTTLPPSGCAARRPLPASGASPPPAARRRSSSEGSLTGCAGSVQTAQAGPTTVTADLFRAKREQVGEQAIVDVALWAGVIGEPAQDAAELRAMAAEGAAGFKSFMASSSPAFPRVDDAQLLAAMETIAPLGLPYGLHAEHDALLTVGLDRMRAARRTDPLAHAESRPPLVETLAVHTALFLAERTRCWLHVCHVASAEALSLIAAAKRRGVHVTCETCPQYLALDTDDLVRLGGFGRCAPAIRDRAEVDAIWSSVLDGTIDLVCSDHCGYTPESKEAGRDDIFAAPLGLSGIQTLLPAFFDGAIVHRGMDLAQFARQIAANPARIFSLYPRKGAIAVGADADVVLLDPRRSWSVRGADMLHRQKWTPFEGKALTGRVLRTIRRGQTIYDDTRDGEARLPATPGSGRFLPRGYGDAG